LANLTLIAADQKQYVNNIITIGITLINTLAIIILTGNRCDLIWVKLGSSLIFVVRPLLYAVYVRKHYHLPKQGKEKAVLEQKWTGIGQHKQQVPHKCHISATSSVAKLLKTCKKVARKLVPTCWRVASKLLGCKTANRVISTVCGVQAKNPTSNEVGFGGDCCAKQFCILQFSPFVLLLRARGRKQRTL